MKYKIIGITSFALMLLISVLNYPRFFSLQTEKKRFHQHLDAPVKAACMRSHAEGELCSHLPLISIHTGGVAIPGVGLRDEHGKRVGFTTADDGADIITAQMEVFDNDTQYNHLTDSVTLSSDIEIHVRGNSSRFFDKQGYSVKLVHEDGSSNPQAMLGMDAHQDWVLHGPYIDKTLIRNYMWYNIAGEIMDYAPNVRFCEVFVNDEYRGVYVLVESITAGKNGSRLNLEVDAKHNTFSGYVIRLDRGSDNPLKNVNTFSKYALRTQHTLNIAFPGSSALNEELAENIRQDFSQFEKMLYSYDYDNPKLGYENYLDLDSFVDFFLINEFTCNYDAGWLSTYMYKDFDRKYRMCIWDFNSACDNYQESNMQPNHFEMQNCLWYVMLTKDETFTERIVSRYRELRQTYFSEDYLYDYINGCVEFLGPAIDRNFEKWGYTFEQEHDVLKPTERNARSYGEAIDNMERFLQRRIDWMDNNIESIKQYSNASKIKKFDEDAN